MCTHESWAAGGWERSALLGEAWKSGRNVPEQGAADAAVVQRATVEHQTDLNLSTPRRAWKWSSPMLCFHVTVDDDGRSRGRQPTGSTRNWAVRRTSWFAVDGSERVGVSPRKTADLRKIVTFSQIHTT